MEFELAYYDDAVQPVTQKSTALPRKGWKKKKVERKEGRKEGKK